MKFKKVIKESENVYNYDEEWVDIVAKIEKCFKDWGFESCEVTITNSNVPKVTLGEVGFVLFQDLKRCDNKLRSIGYYIDNLYDGDGDMFVTLRRTSQSLQGRGI